MNDDKKIDLSTSENTLILESEKYKAKIKGIDASEFPLIPELKEKPVASFPPARLREAIFQVLVAPSYDETKPVLSGVYFKIQNKEAKLVATDSFRLAEKKLILEKEAEDKRIVIPSKTLSEVLRIISLVNPASVAVAISSNQVLFILDDVHIVSRLIEGSFPDYEPIIPKSTDTEVTLDVAEFQNTLKIANLFARESGSNVKLKIEKTKMTISAVSPLLGENTSTISASINGPEVEITFNAKFLLDALSVVGTPKITLGVSGRLNPGVIRPFGRKDYLYLIMPLQAEE